MVDKKTRISLFFNDIGGDGFQCPKTVNATTTEDRSTSLILKIKNSKNALPTELHGCVQIEKNEFGHCPSCVPNSMTVNVNSVRFRLRLRRVPSSIKCGAADNCESFRSKCNNTFYQGRPNICRYALRDVQKMHTSNDDIKNNLYFKCRKLHGR